MEANIICLVIIFCAALIKGSTGFGFSMAAVPLLTFLFPLKELIPLITICSLMISIVIILQKKDYKFAAGNNRLLFWAMLGTIIGSKLLSQLDESAFVLPISIVLTILLLLVLAGVTISFRKPNLAIGSLGLISGILAGTLTISGPPLTLLMNGLHISKPESRELFARFDIITSITALVTYAATGLLSVDILPKALLFTPLLYTGAYIGKKINSLISQELYQIINLMIALFSCALLIYKSGVIYFGG